MVGLVSVIIPTYNRSAFLKEAIESVISQTYRPIECIIVDDGSTDDTKKVVEEIGNKVDKNFKLVYIFQENSGSQIARNTGTKASSGEFIQYLDSDDLLYPDKLEKQVMFLKEDTQCDGVFGDWEKGTQQKKELILAHQSDDMLTQLLTERVVHTLAFLFRRRIVKKIGEWDVNIKRNQEIDFQVRGLLEGANYKYQKLTCGLWRIHDGERIANTTGAKEFLIFFNKWENILKNRGLLKPRITKNIANTLFWIARQKDKKIGIKTKSLIMSEAFRLNPGIEFANSSKMKLLRKFFPIHTCAALWLHWEKINHEILSKKSF